MTQKPTYEELLSIVEDVGPLVTLATGKTLGSFRRAHSLANSKCPGVPTIGLLDVAEYLKEDFAPAYVELSKRIDAALEAS